LSLCATATLLEQYAFSSEVPDDIACERLEPDTVLLWSGKREPTFVEGLLSVARVAAPGKVGYALAANLVRLRALTTIEGAVDFSRMRANLTGIGLETGYEHVLGSNHFGRNIVPSHALFQVSGAPGGGD
jgi:hypothetical protein